MVQVQSPTVGRRRLGAELRRLREAAGFTHVQVAEKLDCSQGKISKMETGRVPIRTLEVKAMAELYGLALDQIDNLLALAKDSKNKGWWQSLRGNPLPPGFDTFLGLETAASTLHTFSSGLIPPLLHTKEYAQALRRTWSGIIPVDIEKSLTVCHARQERLSGTNPLTLNAVIEESALRRIVGSVETTRQQLRDLMHVTYRANVAVRILPNSLGVYPLIGDNVHLLEFAHETDPAVVFLENSAGWQALHKADEVLRYQAAIQKLTDMAMNSKESAALIAKIADELS